MIDANYEIVLDDGHLVNAKKIIICILKDILRPSLLTANNAILCWFNHD